MHPDPMGPQRPPSPHFKRQHDGKGKGDDIAQENDLDRGIMIHQAFGQAVIDAKGGDPGTHQKDACQVMLALMCVCFQGPFPCGATSFTGFI